MPHLRLNCTKLGIGEANFAPLRQPPEPSKVMWLFQKKSVQEQAELVLSTRGFGVRLCRVQPTLSALNSHPC